MPTMMLRTSANVAQVDALLAELSTLLAKSLGKPERYVLVSVDQGPMRMAGSAAPAAFADVRSIGGLDGPACARVSGALAAVLERTLAIPPDRVYLNFTDVAADRWGWNGATFA